MATTDYQKINTLFMRDEKNIIIPTQMTCQEFEYLKDNLWECTEKIDGTNIHIDVVGGPLGVSIQFCGRTERAQIPEHLQAKLKEILTCKVICNTFKDQIAAATEDDLFRVSIYGEGYGVKIQKGGNYIKDDVGFILFDVKVGKWWLNRESCEKIAAELGVPIVPLVGYMTIPQAIEYVKTGFKSIIAENKNYDAEGLVLKTSNGLLFRNGERIITKIKTCDFQKYKAKYGDGPVEQKVNSNYKK